MVARMLLRVEMDQVVSLKGKFASENFLAVSYIALVALLVYTHSAFFFNKFVFNIFQIYHIYV